MPTPEHPWACIPAELALILSLLLALLLKAPRKMAPQSPPSAHHSPTNQHSQSQRVLGGGGPEGSRDDFRRGVGGRSN